MQLSKIQITHDNYPIIKDVLPPLAHELITVLGLDKALILLKLLLISLNLEPVISLSLFKISTSG